MMGYPRCDIMQSPAAGDFMAGALTDAVTVGKRLGKEGEGEFDLGLVDSGLFHLECLQFNFYREKTQGLTVYRSLFRIMEQGGADSH